MAFWGHLQPGVKLLLLGLWQMTQTILRYVRLPSAFQSSVWFPASAKGPLRYAELIFIGVTSFYFTILELFLTGPVMLDGQGNLNALKAMQLEHASMSAFFVVYALVALATEGCFFPRCRPLPRGILHVLYAAAEAQVILLFFFHSGDNTGITGHYHNLMLLPVALSAFCVLLEAAYPHALVLTLVRTAATQMHGLMFILMAFAVYDPKWTAMYCDAANYPSTCISSVWTHRALSLANLQFGSLMAMVLVFMVLLFVVVRHFYGISEDEYLPVEQDGPKHLSSGVTVGCWPQGSDSNPKESQALTG